jgi:hypothetical protein
MQENRKEGRRKGHLALLPGKQWLSQSSQPAELPMSRTKGKRSSLEHIGVLCPVIGVPLMVKKRRTEIK